MFHLKCLSYAFMEGKWALLFWVRDKMGEREFSSIILEDKLSVVGVCAMKKTRFFIPLGFYYNK